MIIYFHYLLDFAASDKRYSYAASFGKAYISEQYTAKAQKLLNSFQSLVLIHTSKGESIFESIKSEIDYKRTILESSLQSNLMHPTVKGKNYDRFWKDHARLPTERFLKKYFFKNGFRKFRKWLGTAYRGIKRHLKR